MKVYNDVCFWRKKYAFFGKWTLNLGKISDRKRHIQDGSSKFCYPKKFFLLCITNVTVYSENVSSVAYKSRKIWQIQILICKILVSLLRILKSAISLQPLMIKCWNFGFIIPSRWFSWKYPFEMIFRISIISLSQHISDS